MLKDATILIVDDEPALCEIFAHWITQAGCKDVRTAADGESALSILHAHRIDLLVSDIRMPKMDGVALVRSLAGMRRPIPSVIFVSAFGDVSEREMYGLGVEAFLAKPADRSEFLKTVEKALAERTALWLEPMLMSPKQSMNITVETGDKGSFHLGHGGFSAHFRGPLSLGRVSFQCSFSFEQREMTGEGYVRWCSKSEEMVGIEFAFLNPLCRSWVIDEMVASGSRGYIPNVERTLIASK